MKKIIFLLLLLIFTASCRSDSDLSEEITMENYVGSWYVTRLINQSNGEQTIYDTQGTCSAKSNFNISRNGVVIYTVFNDPTNCQTFKVYNGNYDDNKKILTLDNYENLTGNIFGVEFINNTMNLKSVYKMPNNASATLTIVTIK